MSSGLLPPFGEPSGERAADAVVLDRFIHGDNEYFSTRFHIEGATLLADRDVAVAMRLGPRTVLVRVDAGDAQHGVKQTVEAALVAAGMARHDEETLLAVAIAVQVLGLRMSTWDLWGVDIDEAFVDLRMAAAGEWGAEFFPEGPPMLGPEPD